MQDRIHDFHAPRTTALLNEKWKRTLLSCVTEGMTVQKGTNDFSVTIGAGSWLCDGVSISETAALQDVVTLDPPDGADRIDVIYGEFAYEADTGPTPASYHVLKGTPGANPVEPQVGTNQVKIASIYVPSAASTLDDCQIRPAKTLREQLEMLLERQVEGNIWVRERGGAFVPASLGNPPLEAIREYEVRDGDLWVDLTGLDLYIYDADNNRWITSDVPNHRTTHYKNGSDEIDVGFLADAQGLLHKGDKETHDSFHISHQSLSDVGKDDHHPQDHGPRHSCGAEDPVDIKDLCDSEGYRHKHATPLAPCKHGNECHDPTFALENHNHDGVYAPDPHDHSHHSGVISRGWIGFEMRPALDCPVGDSIWLSRATNIEIPNTKVLVDELHVYFASPPSGATQFAVRVNNSLIGTVTVDAGNDHGYVVLGSPPELHNGDELRVDAPDDTYGAKGIVFRAAIHRESVPAGGGE